jgi:hypothetical protein
MTVAKAIIQIQRGAVSHPRSVAAVSFQQDIMPLRPVNWLANPSENLGHFTVLYERWCFRDECGCMIPRNRRFDLVLV